MLEFGTLGGYSSIWIGRALPEGGRLTTLEADPAYAEVARENIAEAGLADLVDLRVGPALEALPHSRPRARARSTSSSSTPTRSTRPEYFAWSLDHTRPGGLIVADNVVRGGTLAEAR